MCVTCDAFEARIAAATLNSPSGAVAQLVERFDGIEEVARSIRVGSTQEALAERSRASFLAGLAAGEGCFSVTVRRERFRDGSPRLRFRFSLAMAARDRPLLIDLRDLLGCGAIYDAPGARPEWLPSSTFEVGKSAELRRFVIPFADRYLMPSAKRRQFDAWHKALLSYERDRPTQYGRGRSRCSEPECELPVRGRSLCRRHYYRVTGY